MAARAAAADVDQLAKFTCAVCLNVLADPCSLSCGHSFDRWCVARSLAVKQECPTCRAPQASKEPPEVAVLLRDALAMLFPDEIAKRGKQLEEERAAERARLAAEAAARREEARRRAAQPRPAGPLHDGATMFAMFQVPIMAGGAPGGPPDAFREYAEAMLARLGVPPRPNAASAGRRAAAPAAAPPATDPSTAGAGEEGPRGRPRRRRPAQEAEAEAPPPRRQRRGAAAREASPPPGLASESDDDGPPGIPPFMEAMLNAAAGGPQLGGLPLGLAGLLAPMIGRMMRQQHAGGSPFAPMHFHMEIPDDSPPPQPRRRPE